MSIYEQFTENDLTILRHRARQAARASHRENQSDAVDALTIEVGAEKYALPVERLAAVHDDLPVIPVPCVPSCIAGIANIRGHIIPVIDLAVLLIGASSGSSDSGKLVVVNDHQITVAFHVRTVGEVVSIATDSLSEIPFVDGSAPRAYLRGMSADGLTLLDVEAVLTDPALVVYQTTN